MRNKFVNLTKMDDQKKSSFGTLYLNYLNGFFDKLNNDIDRYVGALREIWNGNDIMMNAIDQFHAFVTQWEK